MKTIIYSLIVSFLLGLTSLSPAADNSAARGAQLLMPHKTGQSSSVAKAGKRSKKNKTRKPSKKRGGKPKKKQLKKQAPKHDRKQAKARK